MKLIKWKKKWSKDLTLFYKDNNLIIDGMCNPSSVFINIKLETHIRKAYYDYWSKKRPYKSWTKKALNEAIAWDMLNYMPAIDNNVKDGYVKIALVKKNNK